MAEVKDAVLESLGYKQLTGLDTAKTVATATGGGAVPVGTRYALIQAESQAIRWTDDNVTTPTAALGMPLAAGSDMWFTGDINKLKFIEQAASAKVNINFYR